MFALLALAWLVQPGAAHAQPSEIAIKSAFLPKFARYVDWPAAARPPANQPLLLCMIGPDPFGRAVDEAASREQVDGRSIAVRRLAGTEGADGCHVAFVRGQNGAETAQMLAGIANRPILTVTDGRFGPQRGMIHFTISGGRVRFFIDDAAAGQRGLSISSRLLALALGVRQRRG